ncbi:MAG: hypothetical protein H9864_06690 [Candidatus Faecalibacterium intestinavium]|uniref:Uncharacterized protein n=1 Tax=Candidatus Faecalibacterium intestinavium TaxID=2838580 RepID=A0A9E2KLK1_9FIRM|nr:hypothetical protein [Candidatus Faecalibacterium intestinavium]
MHLSSRILSAALTAVLAVSALCLPVSAAKYDALTFPDSAGNQVTYVDQQYQDISELPIGAAIILTGMPDYNAAYNDGQYNYVGFNTDKGTWYIRLGSLGSSSVDALKKIVPDDGSITEFTACGVYVGLLAANGLPVVDLAQGQALVYSAQAGGDAVHPLASELPQYQQQIDAARAAQAAAEAAAAQQAAKEAEFTSRGLPYVEYTPTGKMVWIPTRGGTKYHSYSGCSGMIDPQKVDLGYAEARGFGACKRCH